ncbi:MAG TPA: acyl-CoA dehydrogenase family protein [Amycolatopsis sp.]|nr:acyl-CoA dehydrogenase family protein [Amycolatopsis sp.]
MLTLNETEEEQRFRAQMRAWAEEHIPEHLRWREDFDSLQEIDRILAAHGLLAVSWPAEYGGRALSPTLELILTEELGRVGVQKAKSPSHSGINNLGPALIAHASPEQLAFFLPKILAMEIKWCQGFSEPEAGSDLASLRTTARLDGDHWVVNGSKIWTSGAQHANWIYALVRTGTPEQRHRGITFLVFEMGSEGITFRPIEQITGGSDFCEVFFDDVLVPKANVIGEVGGGWPVAMTLLASERLSGRHRYNSFRRQYEALAASLAGESDAHDLHRELGRAIAEVEGMAALGRRVESLREAGGDLGALPQVNKLWWPVAHQRLTELGWKVSTARRTDPSDWYFDWLAARPESIYGGSAQIQRNIISERFLGLPRAPRPST